MVKEPIYRGSPSKEVVHESAHLFEQASTMDRPALATMLDPTVVDLFRERVVWGPGRAQLVFPDMCSVFTPYSGDGFWASLQAKLKYGCPEGNDIAFTE